MNRVMAGLTMLCLAAGTGTPLRSQTLVRDVDDGGSYPAGWSAWSWKQTFLPYAIRLRSIKFVPMGDGYHLTVGNQTTALVYRLADEMNGPFRFEVKFTKAEEPFDYPEGYGLFFGGKHLAGDGPTKMASDSVAEYIYFLVRSNGRYLIRRRRGLGKTDVKLWTPHPAIRLPDATRHSTNVLAIEGQWNSPQVVFLVNGQRVDSMAVTADDLKGLVGIRAIWDQDLHVSDYSVQRK